MKELVFTIFTLLSVNAAYAEQTNRRFPPDFFSFYDKFRSMLQKENYKAINELTCFPFIVYDYTDGIATKMRAHKVGKSKFIKSDLGKYLLNKHGGITDTISESGKSREVVLYKNYREIVIENDNPERINKLSEGASSFDQSSGAISIMELKFEKKDSRWCWAEGGYVDDLKLKW